MQPYLLTKRGHMWQVACLVSCFAVTLGCGTMYAYSAYAPQLSDRLGLSASTISSIGMIGNFSMSLSGPIAGMIVDTKGFLFPVLCSIVCTFSGYATVLTAYEKSIGNVWLLALALFLIGIGATCAFSASVKCAAVNFPHIRGTATALTMSGYGLSAFLMSMISRLTQNSTKNTGGGAGHMLSVLATVPTILMCVFGPIVIKSQPKSSSRSAPEEYGLDALPSDLLIERINERTRSEREVYGFSLLKTPMFWYYFIILGIMAGMGQAYIYTCGYMVKALLADKFSQVDAPQGIDQSILAPLQAQQVAIISLANCMGRIFSGTISDGFKNKLRVSRLYSLCLALIICFFAMITARNTKSVERLWIPSMLSGWFYGAIFGAFPGIISDTFGVKRLSSNWGLVALAPIPFSTWLAIRISRIYDSNTTSGFCAGPACYNGAYRMHIGLVCVVLLVLIQALRVEHGQSKPK